MAFRARPSRRCVVATSAKWFMSLETTSNGRCGMSRSTTDIATPNRSNSGSEEVAHRNPHHANLRGQPREQAATAPRWRVPRDAPPHRVPALRCRRPAARPVRDRRPTRRRGRASGRCGATAQRAPARPMFRAKNDRTVGNGDPAEDRGGKPARVNPAGVRRHRARPRLRRATAEPTQTARPVRSAFRAACRDRTCRPRPPAARRPRARPADVGHPPVNRLPLEDHQRGVVALPGVGGQSRLQADLLQEGLGVESVIDRHARQQQSAVVAALDQQAVLADHHRGDAVFAAGGHRLGPPQHPDVDVELVQFGAGDGRKPRVVGRRAVGGMVQRIAQRHRRPKMPAARPQPPLPPQRHERAVDVVSAISPSSRPVDSARLPPHRRRHSPARRQQHRRLLFLRKLRPRADWRSRRFGRRTIHNGPCLQC